MRTGRIRSIFGSPYEKYFENGAPDPLGDLLGGGIGLPTYYNDWWDTRELFAYPYYNLCMMVGSGTGVFRDERGFQCDLSSNTFFFTFPGVKSAYSPLKGEPWGELYASFAGDLFDPILKQNIISPSQPVWRTFSQAPWLTRLQEILQTPPPLTPFETTHRAVRFLNFLLELLQESQPVLSGQSEGDWFFRACKMLTNDLHHQVDLKDIARELDMSYHTFRAYFTKRAGVPPMRYRDDIRLQRACDHLKNNRHKTCQEIAFDLGFNDSHHFSEYFRRHKGLSPLEFRQKHLARKTRSPKI